MMAKSKPISGEVAEMDFARAIELFLGDIRPGQTSAASSMQEVSTAFKTIKKECHIPGWAMKAFIALFQMEDTARDKAMRALNGLCKQGNLLLSVDMVDKAQGETEDRPPIPTKKAEAKPDLVVHNGGKGKKGSEEKDLLQNAAVDSALKDLAGGAKDEFQDGQVRNPPPDED